jgi:hypothetical protein
MQSQEGREKNIDAIALEDDVVADEESNPAQGNEGEKL